MQEMLTEKGFAQAPSPVSLLAPTAVLVPSATASNNATAGHASSSHDYTATWIVVAVAGMLALLLVVSIITCTAHRYWQRRALEERLARRLVSDCNNVHTVTSDEQSTA